MTDKDKPNVLSNYIESLEKEVQVLREQNKRQGLIIKAICDFVEDGKDEAKRGK